MLVAPVVLIACLAAVFLAPSGVREPDVRNLLLGTVGGVFALLPLRAVLVPQGIEGLTFVDWCLGAEVMLFVAVALLGVARAAAARAGR